MGEVGLIGIIAGYSIFAIFYIVAIIAIFIDICNDYKHYSQLVEDDIRELESMGLKHKIDGEYAEQLALRLKGIKEESGMDDQLLQAAMNLKAGQYQVDNTVNHADVKVDA